MPQPSETKLQVFISYSRNDADTAERLRDALIARGFGAYLDKHDILPGEPWKERLAQMIETADKVVFLLSPDSVASAVCDWEVNEAERLGKRILPVVIRDAPPDAVPGRLKRLNYVFLRDDAEEREGLARLEAALLTDIAWVREHTRLGERAAEWARKSRAHALLLRSSELAAAELWVSRAHSGDQSPTDLHRTYITASREAEQARAEADRAQVVRTRRLQNWVAWGLGTVAILVLAGAVSAVVLAREAATQRARILTSLAQQAIEDGQFRSECLNAHWFMCLADATEKCEAWRRDDNEVRPHSAIGNKPPVTLIERSAAHGHRRPQQAGKSSSG
jgi:hypothetical protein